MYNNISLRSLHTFSTNAFAQEVVIISSEYMLLKWLERIYNQGRSVFILGGGSNVLFLENYIGIILLNRIKGICITEDKTSWFLHVGAGEKWSNLVIFTLNKNIPGLENLAGIPGRVGAAPIQNIGAYGLELSQVCEYVDVLALDTGQKIRFVCLECHFKYRDSIFRNSLNKYIVIYVGLKLCKNWKPVLHYHELMYLNMYVHRITPIQIFNIICFMRFKKLPNPVINGNAGSFFKNPIIDIKTADYLFATYPNIPYYYQSDNTIKLSAGWLIESCHLKGYVLGEASVYYKHALILINTRQMATGTEIAALALYVYDQVLDKYGIRLQPEIRFIGHFGEVHPNKLFQKQI